MALARADGVNQVLSEFALTKAIGKKIQGHQRPLETVFRNPRSVKGIYQSQSCYGKSKRHLAYRIQRLLRTPGCRNPWMGAPVKLPLFLRDPFDLISMVKAK